MLKTVNSFNLLNSKCGEIFCQGLTNFSITCCLCETKTVEYNNFIEHFINKHGKLIDALEVEEELSKTATKRENAPLLNDVQSKKNEVAVPKSNSSQEYLIVVENKLIEDKQLVESSLTKVIEESESKDQDKSKDLKRQKDTRTNWPATVVKTSNEENASNKQKNKLKCPLCGIYKNNKYNLQSHINSHTGARPYNCQKCGNNFTNSGNLWKHIELVHKGIRTHECSECKKKFQYKSQVKRHEMRVHFKVRPFPCDACESSFCTKRELTEHQRKHLSTETDIADLAGSAKTSTFEEEQDQKQGYVCEHCGKSFAKYSGIWAHRRSHSKEKRYVCNVCNRPMHTAYHLKEHMNTHTGERPHKCEVCGKAFQQKKFLRDHKRIHAEVKAFACKLCDKKFSQAAGLYCHSKTHKEI